MIAGLSYYQICSYFLLYSFIGWVVEVIFHAASIKKVVNRGFLNGPVCPIYGFGVLAVFAIVNLSDFPDVSGSALSAFALFLCGMAVTTLIELIGGWALDRLFHARWWDYGNRPLNFHGYICLPFSIIWGLAVLAAVYLLHPSVARRGLAGRFLLPEAAGWPILAVLYLVFFTDLGLTLAVLIGLNQRLRELDAMRMSMRRLSDSLSGTIAETTIAVGEEAQIVEGKIAEISQNQDIHSPADAVRAGISVVSEAGKAGISAVSEAGKAGISAVSEAGKAGISVVSEAGKAGISAVSEAGKAGISAVSEAGKAGISAVSEVGKAGISAVSEKGRAGISAVSEKGKAGINAVSEVGKVGISAVSEKGRAGREAAQEKLRVLQASYERLISSILSRKRFGIPRLIRAFPEMVRNDYPETFALLRRRLQREQEEEEKPVREPELLSR